MPGPVTVAPAFNQVWEILVEGEELSGHQAVLNSMRYLFTPTTSGPPIGAFAAAELLGLFVPIWRTNILPLLANSYVVNRYNVRCIVASNPDPRFPTRANLQYGGRIAVNGTPADVGSRGASPNPAFVTASVAWRSSTVSRFTRSKLGLSPLTDDDVDGDVLETTYAGLLNTALTALRGSIVATIANATFVATQFSGKLAISASLGSDYSGAATYAFPIIGHDLSLGVGSELHRKLRSPMGS